jgi:hypothetical protein
MSDKKTVTCYLFLVCDEEGDYAAGVDAESARASFEETIGELCNREQVRTIRVVVEVPIPEMPTLKGTAPDVGEASLKSVE